MGKISKALFGIAILLTGFSSHIFADVAVIATPIEVLLLEADYVVVGKLKLDDNKKKADLHRFQGVLNVASILKGKKETKAINVYGKYSDGLEGIWILKHSEKGKDGFYDLEKETSSSSYNYLKNTKTSLAKVKKILGDIVKLKWSKPVKGLSLAAYVFKKGRYNSWTLMLAVRNTSKKMFRITNYPGRKPLAITVTAPDGKKTKTNLYSYVDTLKKTNKLPDPKAVNFKEVKAGQSTVFLLTNYGRYLGRFTKKGHYKISASYSYGVFEAKGGGIKVEDEKVKDLWKGEATATTKIIITKDSQTKVKQPQVIWLRK